MNELRVSVATLARQAQIDETTIRALLSGSRWPRTSSSERLERALGWPPGALLRRARVRPELREFKSSELLAELSVRAEEYELRVG